MKYIIKNCPAYLFKDICSQAGEYDKGCSETTDCLIKQVVEKCKEETKYCDDCQHWCCDDCNLNTNGFAQEILDMFEIEEIKE